MPTSKFINEPDEVVDDALFGLVRANKSITFHKTVKRVIHRSIIDGNRVSLIAGGGSGHEPFAAGFVGRGMLTAAVAGNVFASPPSHHVMAALEETQTKAGTILFIINYTGDRLHFGLAAERWKAKHPSNKIKTVTIADDIAIDTKSETGRRGLAGAVLMLKIAGAMSEEGRSIEDIEETCQKVNGNLNTIGISLKPCSVPGQGLMFEMPEDVMEIGLGIHGEPGTQRDKLQYSKDIINILMTKLKVARKDNKLPCALMLNNLGSVSQLEMLVLQNDLLKWCEENSMVVERFFCGTYMTSLDGHGISITVLDLFSQSIEHFLDADCQVPAWIPGRPVSTIPKHKLANNKRTSTDESAKTVKGSSENDNNLIHKCLKAMCDEIHRKKDYLNELDGRAGDGDCGSTLDKAAETITQYLDEQKLPLNNLKQLMEKLSAIFEENVGGTTGAIYAIMLSSAASNIASSPKEVATAIVRAYENIQKYGGAKPGSRTLVDALHGAVQEFQNSKGDFNEPIDWHKVIKSVEKAAVDTSKMVATSGRASYTRAEVQTEPDPGAMAVFYWMRSCYETLMEENIIQ